MSTSAITIGIGPFVVGEKPDPLEYQFLDSNGAAMPITGYSARFTVRERSSASPTVNNVVATISNGAAGKVTYTWLGTEFPTAGHYIAEIWIGNGTQRYASILITFDVRNAVGTTPTI